MQPQFPPICEQCVTLHGCCFFLGGAFRQKHLLPASLAHCPFSTLYHHKLMWSLQVYKENLFGLMPGCSFAKWCGDVEKSSRKFQEGAGEGASFFWITEGKAAASTEVSLTPTEIQTSLCFHFPALSKLWLTSWAVTGDRLSCGFCQVPDFHLLLKTSRNSV